MPLTFGQDYTCPTCKGSGRVLNDKLECGVCHGTGLYRNVKPPPEPTPFERGMDASADAANAKWTQTERLQVAAAIRRVAGRYAYFTADEVWAELGPGFPVTKGMASVLNTIARKGEIEVSGQYRTSARTGEHGHAQRLTLWRSRRVYLDQQAERNAGAE